MSKLAALGAAMLFLIGCSSDSTTSTGFDSSCGLPSPHRGVDASIVPDEFEIPGAQLTRTRRTSGGFAASLNLPYSVEEGMRRYLRAVRSAGFDVVGRDFEGFEAEIYIRKPGAIGAVQLRVSRCEDATGALVNVVADVTPTPSASP